MPPYDDASNIAGGALNAGGDNNGVFEGVSDAERRRSVPRSSKHPRVAVLLGVSSKWYLPLLLCRALSVTSAVWWALPIVASVLRGLVSRDTSCFEVLDVTALENSTSEKRLARVEVVLAFLWVCFGLEVL